MILPIGLRCGLDSAFVRLRFLSSFCVFHFILFYFFSAAVFDQVFREQYIHALFTDPTNYSNFFIKNRSHSTIYLFKNYFATVFYISVFSFSTNKLYPNGPVKITFLYTRIPTVFRTESMIVSC